LNFYTGHTSSHKNIAKADLVKNYMSNKGGASGALDSFNQQLIQGMAPKTLANPRARDNELTVNAKQNHIKNLASLKNCLKTKVKRDHVSKLASKK